MTKRSVVLASFELATKTLSQKRGHEGQIRRAFQYNINIRKWTYAQLSLILQVSSSF